MKRKLMASTLLLVTTVAALAMGKRDVPQALPEGENDTCNAVGYADFLGANPAAVTLPADLPHRMIGPGEAVTQDFRPNRINFDHNGEGRIIRIWCG